MTTPIIQFTIHVGVPQVGTPSVWRVTAKKRDSEGDVECVLSGTDKKLLLQALVRFMGALLE